MKHDDCACDAKGLDPDCHQFESEVIVRYLEIVSERPLFRDRVIAWAEAQKGSVGFVRRFKTRVVTSLSGRTGRNVQKTYFTCIACGYELSTLYGGVQTTRKEMRAHIKSCDTWKRYEREHAAFLAQGKEGP